MSMQQGSVLSLARAVAGKGKDVSGLSDGERAALRGQAHGWLGGDLKRWPFGEGTVARDAKALRRLQWWQKDGHLANVRDKQALAALPAEEIRTHDIQLGKLGRGVSADGR